MRFKLWLCNLKHIRVKIKCAAPTNCLLPPCRSSSSPPPSSSFHTVRSPSGLQRSSSNSSSTPSYSCPRPARRTSPRQGFSIDCGCARPLSSSSRGKRSSGRDGAAVLGGSNKCNDEQEIPVAAARRSTNSIHDDHLSKLPVAKKKEQEGLISSLSCSSSASAASWSRSGPPTVASTELMLLPACLDPTSAHAEKAWFPAPPIDQVKESSALLLHRMSSSSSLSSSSSGVTKHMNMNSNNGRKEHPSSSRTTSDQDSFFTSFDKGRSSNSSYSSSINDYHPSRRNTNHHHHHHHHRSLSSSSSPSPSPLPSPSKKTAEVGLMKEQLMTEKDEIVHAKLLIKTYSTRRAAGPLEVAPAQYMSPARTVRSCCSSVSSFSRTLLQACTTEAFLKDERLLAGDSDDAGEVLYPWLCDDGRTESVVDLESTTKPWSDYDRVKRRSKTSSRKGANSNNNSSRRRRKCTVEPASTGYSSPLDTPHSVVSSVISSSASSYRRRQRAPANAFRQAAFRYYFGEVTPPSSPDRPLINSSLLNKSRGPRRSSSSSKHAKTSATQVAMATAPGSPPAWSNEQHPVGDSVAIVKRSGDPYIDFRDSMVDMILEKQIYSSADMEELLQCFLSLNSVDHHETIVRAFSEVWEVVFGNASRSPLIACVA